MKFRKWIKYKFSTYYPDPCDFTIYESYDVPTKEESSSKLDDVLAIISGSLFQALWNQQQEAEDMFTAGGRYRREWDLCVDTSKTESNSKLPTYENPPPPPTISYQDRWRKLSPEFRAYNSDPIEKFDKLFGIEDSQTISLSKGIPARAVEKSKPLPNPKPKPPLDRSLKEGVQPIKPINKIAIDVAKPTTESLLCTDLDDGTPTMLEVDTYEAVYDNHLNRFELKGSEGASIKYARERLELINKQNSLKNLFKESDFGMIPDEFDEIFK